MVSDTECATGDPEEDTHPEAHIFGTGKDNHHQLYKCRTQDTLIRYNVTFSDCGGLVQPESFKVKCPISGGSRVEF